MAKRVRRVRTVPRKTRPVGQTAEAVSEAPGRNAAGANGADSVETLLEAVVAEMRILHAGNRERAVKAITQKNNLQQIVDDAQRRVDLLQQKIDKAERNGDREFAAALRVEQGQYVQSAAWTRGQLEAVVTAAEHVRVAIKREEEALRQKTAEARRLQAQWQVLQIQRELAQIAREAVLAQRADECFSTDLTAALREQTTTRAGELERTLGATTQGVETLQTKASFALRRGEREVALQLIKEAQLLDATLPWLREAHAHAVDVVAFTESLLRREADPEALSHWDAAEQICNAEVQRLQEQTETGAGDGADADNRNA